MAADTKAPPSTGISTAATAVLIDGPRDGEHMLEFIARHHEAEAAALKELAQQHIDAEHPGKAAWATAHCEEVKGAIAVGARHAAAGEVLRDILVGVDQAETALAVAVTNAHMGAVAEAPRWKHVMVLFQCSRETAIELCKGTDLDPEQVVGPQDDGSFASLREDSEPVEPKHQAVHMVPTSTRKH